MISRFRMIWGWFVWFWSTLNRQLGWGYLRFLGMIWGWMISRFRMIWGWFVWFWSWLMVWLRWMSYFFVLNIGNESIFMISSIRNNLGTPVRQFNTVLTMNNTIFILSFSLSGVSSIVIYRSILVGEGLWWFLVTFFRMVRRWMMRNRSRMICWFWMIWCWSIWWRMIRQDGSGNKND